MKVLKLMILFLGLSFNVYSQKVTKPSFAQDWVISKNYYASYLLMKNPKVLNEALQEKTINDVLVKRWERFKDANQCKDLDCFLTAFKLTDGEQKDFINGFVAFFNKHSDFKNIVINQLVSSKKYGLINNQTAKDYLIKALAQDFKAINYAIDVYAGGKQPNYPKIDSISFNITKKSFIQLLNDVRQDVDKDTKTINDKFLVSALLAVRLLEINERWDAAQLEPLNKLINAESFQEIKKTNFNKYPYSMILALGAGPDIYNQAISPGGILRCRQVARMYGEGLAPFIMVTGGRVHPYKTPYIEAVEMKKYLVEVLGIPAKAVLIEPHARHTTTNFRNAARIMFNMKMPANKMAVVSSSEMHINNVVKMENRCIKELGYVPYILGKRINDVLLEFKPTEDSFLIDWDEPLDP